MANAVAMSGSRDYEMRDDCQGEGGLISRSQSLTRHARENLVRQQIDSVEEWLRRLIHYRLSPLGTDYLRESGLSPEELQKIAAKIKRDPAAFRRPVDATTFGQAVNIICGAKWIEYFKMAFEGGHPGNITQLQAHLQPLKDVRNSVAHVRGCSARELEKVICYGNDIVDAIRFFFAKEGQQRVFDVPSIIRVTDNLGNSSTLEELSEDPGMRILDWRRQGLPSLSPGDLLTVEVEIDASYDRAKYSVEWGIPGESVTIGVVAQIRIENRHVGETMPLRFVVRAHREWHRWANGIDDQVLIAYRVLPPPTY